MTTLRPAFRTISTLSLLAGLAAGCGAPSQFTAGRQPYGAGQQAAMRDPFLANQGAGQNALASANPAGMTPGAAGQGSPGMQAPPAGGQMQTAMAQPYDPTTNLRHYNRRPGVEGQMATAPPQQYAMAETPQFQQQPGGVHQTAYLQQPSTTNPFAVQTASAPQAPQMMPDNGPVEQIAYQMPARVRDPNPFAEVSGTPVPGQPVYQAPPQVMPAGQTDGWVQQPVQTSTAEVYMPPLR